MEKSSCGSQAIFQEHDDDHAKEGREYSLLMMRSLCVREPLRHGCYDGLAFESASRSRYPNSNSLRANLQPKTATYTRHRQRGFVGMLRWLLVLIASLWIVPTSAVFIEFQNCLSDGYQKNTPTQLQFVPKFVNAVFNTTDPNHNLNVTIWGNVTGSGTDNLVLLPPIDDPYWTSNATNRGGKILDIADPNAEKPILTTLFNKVNVLTYEPWSNSEAFCQNLLNAECPLGPVFFGNESNPATFPAIGFSNNFFSSYAFTSFTATLLIKYGDTEGTPIGCISANITPDVGSSLTGVLTFLPLVVLIFVGFATAFAAIFSPWGTTDTFRWTTNYGRDADLLRLVTPGFGDCLQYIQFIALTGGLTLNYPGFYQPVVSKVAWSALMFNESFVGNHHGTDSLVDGIYVTKAGYGLDVLRQLVGMGDMDDVWTGMVIWLLVIIGAVLALIQVGFLLRWASRLISNTQEEDLRAKSVPFSMGNVIRLVFNYFLLPAVALSMFQLVVASKSPTYTVALAVVMLVLIVGFAIWLLYLIVSTRPKSFLFDDLPTVLLYGSLYNTYSDNAASFALIPVLLTFVRGIAIGAVQPSGIAQLVLLAICEVITVLTLHAFRPFHSPTSMNAYHTFFAVLRFATVLLMVAFAPSLGVTEGPKGWIGYAILLMHAIVLIFGFLLNAIQTIVEVGARMAGAGGDESGAARGGLVKVFGMRQLSRRLPRRDAGSRASQLSNAAMLDSENDRKSYMMDSGRLRSQSAGSTGVLLNRQSTGLESSGDQFGVLSPHQIGGSGVSSYTPTTPGEASTFSFLPSAAAPSGLGRNRGPLVGLASADTADPYYRPPRLRRPTLDAYSPGARSRGSWASGDWANRRWSQQDSTNPDLEQAETFEGPSISGRATPVPPPALDGSPNDPRRSKADYTTREVDFYYGVRGPALNANIPSRRIKTGPADPTGIPASAAGWFKGLFGGKIKEKGKGFEVVRSSRMPPGSSARNAPAEPGVPEGIPVVATDAVRNGPIDSDDESIVQGPSRAGLSKPAPATENETGNLVSPMGSEDEYNSDDDEIFESTRISDIPPVLPGIDVGEDSIELPSRFPSKATSKASSRRAKANEFMNIPLVPSLPSQASRKPSVPRKSSRRISQSVDIAQSDTDFIRQHRAQTSLDHSLQHASERSLELPFKRTNSSKRQSTISTKSSVGPLQNTSALGNHSADLGNERPASVGYVTHHNIRTVNPSENPEYLSSSAVLVDGRHSGASSMENPRE